MHRRRLTAGDGEEEVGVYTAGWYAAGSICRQQKSRDPGLHTADPYTALLIIGEALMTTSGRTEGAAAFLKAMHDVRPTRGPIGPVPLDEYGTPILTIHPKNSPLNGKLTNTIVKTYR